MEMMAPLMSCRLASSGKQRAGRYGAIAMICWS